MIKKHGWDEDARYYTCSDGVHNSFWQSVIGTPEWDTWVKYNETEAKFDVWESTECGWMSPEHCAAFFEFIRKSERDKIKADLLSIADKGEIEDLRREVMSYF